MMTFRFTRHILRGRNLVSAIFVGIGFAAAPMLIDPVAAQASRFAADRTAAPDLIFEGNWLVTRENHPRQGFGRVALIKGLKHEIECSPIQAYAFCRDLATGWLAQQFGGNPGGSMISEYISAKSVDGGAAIDVSAEHNLLTRLSPQDGGQTLTGTWRQGAKTGREVWRRVAQIEIERVTCRLRSGEWIDAGNLSGGCIFALSGPPKKGAMRGNFEGVMLDIYGAQMWGVGPLPIAIIGAGLEVDNFCYIYTNLGTPKERGCHSWGMPHETWGEVIGIRLHINVFFGARSGVKWISLNGVTVPITLDIPKLPSLPADVQSVLFVTETHPHVRLESLAIGQRFRVEVHYASPPDVPGAVTVSDDELPARISVMPSPTNDPLVYRSEPILIEPVSDREGLE